MFVNIISPEYLKRRWAVPLKNEIYQKESISMALNISHTYQIFWHKNQNLEKWLSGLFSFGWGATLSGKHPTNAGACLIWTENMEVCTKMSKPLCYLSTSSLKIFVCITDVLKIFLNCWELHSFVYLYIIRWLNLTDLVLMRVTPRTYYWGMTP